VRVGDAGQGGIPGLGEVRDPPRDFTAPGNIIAEIAQLNRIRRQNPALHTHLGLKVYNAWNDNILYFGKRSVDGSNFILVAVSLDPHNRRKPISNCRCGRWACPTTPRPTAKT
jgi:starch synthase (maltosyl-transferring)